ncbi:MAG: flagellar hook protein FlgE [Bacillota bacterium]|jgi:flagellar hook protein FlgE|nr:flagellar hook protein FlgE [Bacillota bacterium]
MQRSLFTAVTGLRNHQTKLDVIGNNIANVNTIGFKSSRVRFQDVFSQTLRGASAPVDNRGGTNPVQVGMGMTIGAIDTLHTQGTPQFTGVGTDLAIDGKGYFVVTDGVNIYYTRDGALSVGPDGDLVNSASGLKLLGWAADAAGNINTTEENLGFLNIPIGERLITRATQNITFSGNLDAALGVNGTHETDFMVYDSQGGMHTVRIIFTKTADNAWGYQAQYVPPSGSPQNAGSGALRFTENGYLNLSTSTIGNISFTPPGGVGTLNITLDFSNVSQVVADPAVGSNAQLAYQDGFPVGELESFVIGSDGVISGTYTNGLVRDLGQIVLASFANPEGLMKAGGNLYTVSANSGEARIGMAGVEGRGKIQTSALEMSNVDLSYEFTELITTSRAYQANSRVITSSDELLQELVNLKR